MIAEGVLGRLRALPRTRVRRGARRGVAGRRRQAVTARRRLVLAAVLLGLGALAGGGWVWLRSSTLVGVDRVSVTGLSGPDAGQIRASLIAAARGMTTLDVHLATLRAAVAPYPVVAGLRVSTQFPHSMRIAVIERVPVAAVTVSGRSVPVAADGTLLPEVAAGQLPVVTTRSVAAGPRLADPSAVAELHVLAAAPAGMAARIASASSDYWHGVVVALRQGPSIYFGDASDLDAKWHAAVALLANPATTGASYIDVSDPARPAAGVGGTPTSLANAAIGTASAPPVVAAPAATVAPTTGVAAGTSAGASPGTAAGGTTGGTAGTATGTTGTAAGTSGTAAGATGTAAGATGTAAGTTGTAAGTTGTAAGTSAAATGTTAASTGGAAAP